MTEKRLHLEFMIRLIMLLVKILFIGEFLENEVLYFYAGHEGVEPPALGFGDRCSAN